jgi:HEAT repeat protein
MSAMNIQELQKLLNSQEKTVRHKALVQLLQLGSHEAYGILMFAANNHYSPETRHEAKKASLLLQKKLFSTDTPQQKTRELTEQEKEIIQNLKSEEPHLRKAALTLIEKIKKPELLGLLVQYMHRERTPELCSEAVRVCARTYGNASFSHIVSFLRSGSELLRCEVIKAISELTHNDVIPILLRFTRDPAKEVQNASLQALAGIDTKKLVQTMTMLSQKAGNLNKDAIIFVIARLCMKDGFALLAGFLNDEQQAIRERAGHAIDYLEKKGGWISIGNINSTATPESESKDESDTESDSSPKSEQTGLKETEEKKPEESTSEETDDAKSTEEATNEEEELAALSEKEEREKKILLNKITSSDQTTAIPALFEIAQRSWFTLLAEAKEGILERNNSKVLATFIMVLGQSGDNSHRDFLLECLNHNDGRVQANVIEALHRLGFSTKDAMVSLHPTGKVIFSDIKDKIMPFVQSRHDRTKTNALIFLHSSGLINTAEELKSMLQSKRENRQLSAIFAISDLFDPEFIPLLDIPMDSPNPKVTGKAMDTLRMFVLEEHETAINLARKWKILDELQMSAENEETVEEDAEAEESDEKKTETSMDSLLSDLDKPKDKENSKKNDKNNAEKNKNSEKKPGSGMDKIKNFLNNLNNIFNKK